MQLVDDGLWCTSSFFVRLNTNFFKTRSYSIDTSGLEGMGKDYSFPHCQSDMLIILLEQRAIAIDESPFFGGLLNEQKYSCFAT